MGYSGITEKIINNEIKNDVSHVTYALQKMFAVESGQAYPPRYNESIISKINSLVVAPTRIKFKSASLHAKSHNGSCAYVMSSELFLENL